MSKGGERIPAESDMDGRVMALEQTARGLNARLCAIERSYAPERQPSYPKYGETADGPGHMATGVADNDDFVPATGICTAYGQQGDILYNSEIPHTPVLSGHNEKPAPRRSLSLDIAGLAAGIILVVISALLYTGNLEIMKNPVLPFIFGILLIACVCVRRYYS